MPKKITVRDREYAMEMAKEHFKDVLSRDFGELAFILAERDLKTMPGALVTIVIFLSEFVDLFGDLVEQENYTVEAFRHRSKESNFKISDDVFKYWKSAGCLK